MNEEREKLIKAVRRMTPIIFNDDIIDLVEFILEDRKRICAPLIGYMKDANHYGMAYSTRIKKTLELAGLEDGK